MKKFYIENTKEYITVDDIDFEAISQYKWRLNQNYRSRRVLGFVEGKIMALPHFITGVENAYQKVKNLDYRRENIGIDQHKYRYRKPQRNSSSKYKGVRKMKMNSGNYTWISSISFDGKRKHLGCFDSEIEAAKAYNNAVVTYWNGNGYLNDV